MLNDYCLGSFCNFFLSVQVILSKFNSIEEIETILELKISSKLSSKIKIKNKILGFMDMQV